MQDGDLYHMKKGAQANFLELLFSKASAIDRLHD